MSALRCVKRGRLEEGGRVMDSWRVVWSLEEGASVWTVEAILN